MPPISSPLVVNAVGSAIGIDLSTLSDADGEAVSGAWSDTRAPSGTVAVASVTPGSSQPAAQMLSLLSSSVTHAAISAGRGRLWMLHAAGLAAPDGGVVALVGPSGAGKTTAATILGRTWGYVSDETVGIEDDGTVHAYRKPLSVVTDGHGFKAQHSPSSRGLLPLPDAPLRLRRIVLLDRDARHARARLVAVPLAEALVALAPQSSALAALPRPLETLSRLLNDTGGVLRAEYADADQLVDLIRDLPVVTGEEAGTVAGEVEESAVGENTPTEGQGDENPVGRDHAAPAGMPSEDDTAAASDAVAADARYVRSDVVDWCPLPDERLAVLTGEADGRGTLLILAGAAPVLWRAATGATREQMLDAVADRPHDESVVAGVDGILGQLVDAGLLTRSE